MLLLLLIITTTPPTAALTSQYIPCSMPTKIPVANLSDKTYPYRTNWCPTRAAVLNGTMSYALAIRDRIVYLSSDPGFQGGPGNDAEFWKIKYDPVSGYPVSGMIYTIWSALALKLGFHIQWVYVNSQTTSTSTSIQNTVKYVDMYASGMTYDTAARRNIPASFLYPHILQDDMTILAPRTTVTQYSLWNVFTAFAWNLWITLFCALLVNGLLTYFLSPRKPGPDGTTTLAKEGQTLFTDLIWAINAFAGVKVILYFIPSTLSFVIPHASLHFLAPYLPIYLSTYLPTYLPTSSSLSSFLLSSSSSPSSSSSFFPFYFKIEEDRTIPIMILSIGCNILILILQTSYVANLAAVLISNPIIYTQPGDVM